MLVHALDDRGDVERTRRHDRGNGMLVDELGLAITAQQHGEIVEPGNDALKLHALDEEHRDGRLGTAQRVQK